MAGDDEVDDGGHGALVAVAAHEGQVVRCRLGAELAHIVRWRLARAVQRLLSLYRLLPRARNLLSGPLFRQLLPFAHNRLAFAQANLRSTAHQASLFGSRHYKIAVM